MNESPAVPQRVDLLNEWQIEEIRQGIVEADRDEFASDDEVRQLLKRWTLRAR